MTASPSPTPTRDRRFVTVLVSGLVTLLGAGLIAVALIGLQDPVYIDFDTSTRTDTSRTLAGLIALGTALTLAGITTVIALFRAQLRDPRRNHPMPSRHGGTAHKGDRA